MKLLKVFGLIKNLFKSKDAGGLITSVTPSESKEGGSQKEVDKSQPTQSNQDSLNYDLENAKSKVNLQKAGYIDKLSRKFSNEINVSESHIETTLKSFGGELSTGINPIIATDKSNVISYEEEGRRATDVSGMVDLARVEKKLDGITQMLAEVAKSTNLSTNFEVEKDKINSRLDKKEAREVGKVIAESKNANAEAANKVDIKSSEVKSDSITPSPTNTNIKTSEKDTDSEPKWGTKILGILGGIAGFLGLKGAWDNPDSTIGKVLHSVIDPIKSTLSSLYDKFIEKFYSGTNAVRNISDISSAIKGDLTESEKIGGLTERKDGKTGVLKEHSEEAKVLGEQHKWKRFWKSRPMAKGSRGNQQYILDSMKSSYESNRKRDSWRDKDGYEALKNEFIYARDSVDYESLPKDLQNRALYHYTGALQKFNYIDTLRNQGDLSSPEYQASFLNIIEQLRDGLMNTFYQGNQEAYNKFLEETKLQRGQRLGEMKDGTKFAVKLNIPSSLEDIIKSSKERDTKDLTTGEITHHEAQRFDRGKVLYGEGAPNELIEHDPDSGLNKDDVILYSMNRFIEAGLTPEQAAGIVGNLMGEGLLSKNYARSYDDHNVKGEKSGTAFGIAGFNSKGDGPNIERWTRENNVPIDSLGGQLDYLTHLISNNVTGYSSHRKSVNGVPQGSKIGFKDALSGLGMHDTVRSWVSKYEKCAENTKDDSRYVKPRFIHAQQAYDIYSNNVGPIKDLYNLKGYTYQPPVDKKAEGGISKGGATILGEAGKSELVIPPVGKPWITPSTPILTNLDPGTKIRPDAVRASLGKVNVVERIETPESINEVTSESSNSGNEAPLLIDAHQENRGGDTHINNHTTINYNIHSDNAAMAESK